MKRVRYTKYTGDLASEIEMDDLLKAQGVDIGEPRHAEAR